MGGADCEQETKWLGIRNLKLWKFATKEGLLRKEVIIAKYRMEDKWMTKVVTTPYGALFGGN